ncbi:MAG: FKBP-type peptidyl-prolyl cis-trans isomerase [Bacteroidaceae bacterium]|nr:FKBP-type peptidyl-prolyl cis-trans isomerase [Bacteroidaceae bacterium]
MAQNRYIKTAYKMLTNTAASHKQLYESTEEQPDVFVTGMGLMLDAFEEKLAALEAGHTFDFTLQAAEAFGEVDEEKIIDLPRSTFEIKGKFDEENIYPGVEVPLMDSEGNHFPGTIVKVDSETVTVDLNPPLAGYALQFVGKVLENREPTISEMEKTAKILSGECGCGGCGGGDCSSGCGGCGGGCE